MVEASVTEVTVLQLQDLGVPAKSCCCVGVFQLRTLAEETAGYCFLQDICFGSEEVNSALSVVCC